MSAILFLEDELDWADMIAGSLRDLGHDVSLVQTVAEADALLQETRFDALIVDIFIREGFRYASEGGLTLLNRVRRPVKNRPYATPTDVRIVCVSGALVRIGNNDVLRVAGMVGADAMLDKPFSLQALVDALELG